jgi:hypothetical protein
MGSIREVADQPLRWTQPGALKRNCELRAGDEVVETLQWQKAFGSLALADTAAGAWTLKRSGFLRPQVTVRVPGSDAEVAAFKPGWWGEGTLRFSDGARYEWQNTSFWRGQWAFAGEPLHGVAPHSRQFRERDGPGFHLHFGRLTEQGSVGLEANSATSAILRQIEDLGYAVASTP